MNSYFGYYLLWIFISYAMQDPRLLVGVAVLLLLRRFIPAPGALLRLFSRSRKLRAQVALNRANITARRDLAVIYLDGLRPRAAIPLLEEGLKLAPKDPELLYLSGLALHRSGRHEEALTPLVRAVELDSRVRYGLPYLVAGDALAALGRWEQALDAYEHYIDGNSSDVSAYTRLARAHANTGNSKAARDSLHEGLRTWGMLPGSMKRRQFAAYLAAQRARATLLHEPSAILVLVVLVALSAFFVRASYAPVMRWFHDSPFSIALAIPHHRGPKYPEFERCGSQSTGDFTGKYVVVPESLNLIDNPELQRMQLEHYANFEILEDRIVSGSKLRQELCLTRVLDRTATSLHAEAVWHDDVADPGDASTVVVDLRREGGVVSMALRDPAHSYDVTPTPIQLKRL